MIYFDPKILSILKEQTKKVPQLMWEADNAWRRYIPVPDEDGFVRFKFRQLS